jgi:small-conductance mechanosensitive channel
LNAAWYYIKGVSSLDLNGTILFDTALNVTGIVLLFIMRVIGKKRHFKKKPFFLINIFTFYFIVRLLKNAIIPLDFDTLNKSLYLIEVLILALAIVKTVMYALLEFFLHAKRGVEIPRIIQDTIFVFLYFILIMIIIKEILDVNLTSILTTSAVLTMVLGLSLQDNLSNLFSGLAIQLEKPFSIGEWVSFEGTTGKVKELSWRSVKLLTHENDLLIIPNNKIIKENVMNFNRPTYLHISRFNVGVSYRHPPNRVKETILEVLKDEKDIAHEPKPLIRLTDFGDFSINYEIRYYINNFNRVLQIEDSITTKIWYAFNRNGIRIPFPIRDVNLRTVSDKTEEIQREKELTEHVSLLKLVDVLTPLSEDELIRLAEGGKTLFYSTGEEIIKEGESGDALFLILKGEVDVSIKVDKEMKSVATLREKDFFGERSLMTGEAINATITAVKDCVFFVVDKENFKNVISTHQDAIKQISDILSRREVEITSKREEVKKKITESHIQENSKQIFKNIMKFLGF